MKQEGEACKRELRRKENEVVANESERRSLEGWASEQEKAGRSESERCKEQREKNEVEEDCQEGAQGVRTKEW